MQLPNAINEIAIPSYLSPSQLSLEGGCLLKSVLGCTKNGVQRLIPHPRAEIGNIIHKLMELAARGGIEGNGDPGELVKRVFEDLLESTRKKLEIDPRHLSYVDLRSTMPPLEWRRRIRFALDSALRLLDAASKIVPADTLGDAVSLSDIVGDGRWAEVSIVSPSLRLAGRVDILERKNGIITVHDLKTGRVKDETGEVFPHLQSQMCLYGLMVRSLDPKKKIRLVIDHEESTLIPFGEKKVAETEERLMSLLSMLPVSKTVSSTSLAVFGPECLNCSFRHQCTTYLTEAPGRWSSQCEYRLPLDSWGVVQAIERIHADNNEIRLIDQALRQVKVFGLRDVQLEYVKVGSKVWLFGLASDFRGRNQTAWSHPMNFHELAVGSTGQTAWCLQIYAE